MCPHTTISTYFYVCVLKLLYAPASLLWEDSPPSDECDQACEAAWRRGGGSGGGGGGGGGGLEGGASSGDGGEGVAQVLVYEALSY